MTNSNEGTTLQRRRMLRVLLLLPPSFLAIAALALLVASPPAWGAAEVIGAPDWMPAALGVSIALAALAVAAYSLRKTLRDTRGDFDVFGLQLVFGVLMFLSGGLSMLAFAFQLPDPDTYARMLDDDGEYTASHWGLFLVSLAFGAFNVGWVWVGAYLYSHAVSNQQPNRISARSPDEVDGVGELLRERR